MQRIRSIGRSEQTRRELLPMMSNGGYEDRILTCRDCGQDFTFSAGEQEFFASRNLTNEPGRCPSCRAARRNSQSTAPRSRNVEHYETTCADCGRLTSVHSFHVKTALYTVVIVTSCIVLPAMHTAIAAVVVRVGVIATTLAGKSKSTFR